VKLVHLIGFITKKFVTKHGYMNVKKVYSSLWLDRRCELLCHSWHMFFSE